MVTEIIRYSIPENQKATFEQAYAQAQQYLLQSPHCQSYHLTNCIEEPQRYLLQIEWDSLDGHLQGFRNSSEFKNFFSLVRPFFDLVEEMQHYETVSQIALKK